MSKLMNKIKGKLNKSDDSDCRTPNPLLPRTCEVLTMCGQTRPQHNLLQRQREDHPQALRQLE